MAGATGVFLTSESELHSPAGPLTFTHCSHETPAVFPLLETSPVFYFSAKHR